MGPAFWMHSSITNTRRIWKVSLLWPPITLSPCILLGWAAFFYFKAVRGLPRCALGWVGVGGLAIVTGASLAGHFLGQHPLPESVAGLGIVLFARGSGEVPLDGARRAHCQRHAFGMYLTRICFCRCLSCVPRRGASWRHVWWVDVGGACGLHSVHGGFHAGSLRRTVFGDRGGLFPAAARTHLSGVTCRSGVKPAIDCQQPSP